MIDFISTDDLRHLADATDNYCVSIFLPAHPAGNQTAQDPIRLKNLLGNARTELESLHMSRRHIDELLAPVEALHDDGAFWATMGNGLAIFVSTAGMRTYRLPTIVVELAVVAERFHLKPMLSSVTADEVFYVLALSQNEVRLLRGDRFAVNQLSLGEIPASVAEALPYDDREQQMQSHSAGREGVSVTAVFHGQGGGEDLAKNDLDRFLNLVDHGVREIVGATTAPLVLAGTESVVAHYRKTSGYSHIVSGEVRGNPQRLSATELHHRAWPLVEPVLDAVQRRALATVEAASAPILSALTQIVVSAADGRVDTLLVPRGVQRWGTFSPEARVAVEHENRMPGDRDLLDIAAIETLTHGGRVFVVPRDDLPAHEPVAAIMRY